MRNLVSVIRDLVLICLIVLIIVLIIDNSNIAINIEGIREDIIERSYSTMPVLIEE